MEPQVILLDSGALLIEVKGFLEGLCVGGFAVREDMPGLVIFLDSG